MSNQIIIDAVISNLTDIPVLSQNVGESRTTDAEKSEIPRTSVTDRDEIPISQDNNDKFIYELPLTIEIELSGDLSRKQAREITDTVLQKLGDDEKLGGLAQATNPQSVEFDSTQDEQHVTTIFINIIVIHETDKWRF